LPEHPHLLPHMRHKGIHHLILVLSSKSLADKYIK
jgi:hypothetical protein